MEGAVWMDALRLLVVLIPLLSWSGIQLNRTPDPLSDRRRLPPRDSELDLQAAPATHPHQEPAP